MDQEGHGLGCRLAYLRAIAARRTRARHAPAYLRAPVMDVVDLGEPVPASGDCGRDWTKAHRRLSPTEARGPRGARREGPTPAPRAHATEPKAHATEPKAHATKREANTSKREANTSKPKANTIAPEVRVSKREANATMREAN